MLPLHTSDTAIEIETNVSARIKRVIFGAGRDDFNLGNAGKCCQGQGVVAEEKIAIAALKAGFEFQPYAALRKLGPCPAAHGIMHPIFN